jgi:hypothetical protein
VHAARFEEYEADEKDSSKYGIRAVLRFEKLPARIPIRVKKGDAANTLLVPAFMCTPFEYHISELVGWDDCCGLKFCALLHGPDGEVERHWLDLDELSEDLQVTADDVCKDETKYMAGAFLGDLEEKEAAVPPAS